MEYKSYRVPGYRGWGAEILSPIYGFFQVSGGSIRASLNTSDPIVKVWGLGPLGFRAGFRV